MRRFVLQRDAPVRRALGLTVLFVLGPPVAIAISLGMAFLFYGMTTLKANLASLGPVRAVFAILVAVFTAAVSVVQGRESYKRLRSSKKPCGSVVVGLDGVLVQEGEAAGLVRWTEVSSIRHATGSPNVVLELEGGVERELCVSEPTLFAKELRKARERAEELSGRKRLSVLALGSEDEREWAARVKRAIRVEEYRAEPISEEALVAVLEDPTQSADQRLGAALALPQSETRKHRLRVAAETTADPALAEALEEAIGGDISEPILRRALATK